jgi:hypothetical protein
MTINIDLPAQELAALKQATKANDDAAAVVQAAREFLRISRLRELKSVSGKVDFDENWQTYEELELGESSFPQ